MDMYKQESGESWANQAKDKIGTQQEGGEMRALREFEGERACSGGRAYCSRGRA